MRASFSDCSRYLHCSSFRIFVLPHSDDLPACYFESPVRVDIALLVGFDLLTPKFSVAFRGCAMLGAAVPEATIDQYGNVCLGECHVCGSSRPLENWVIHAISKTLRMDPAPNLHLGRCISLADRLHAAAGDLRRRFGIVAVRHLRYFVFCPNETCEELNPNDRECFERLRGQGRPAQRCQRDDQWC